MKVLNSLPAVSKKRVKKEKPLVPEVPEVPEVVPEVVHEVVPEVLPEVHEVPKVVKEEEQEESVQEEKAISVDQHWRMTQEDEKPPKWFVEYVKQNKPKPVKKPKAIPQVTEDEKYAKINTQAHTHINQMHALYQQMFRR